MIDNTTCELQNAIYQNQNSNLLTVTLIWIKYSSPRQHLSTDLFIRFKKKSLNIPMNSILWFLHYSTPHYITFKEWLYIHLNNIFN